MAKVGSLLLAIVACSCVLPDVTSQAAAPEKAQSAQDVSGERSADSARPEKTAQTESSEATTTADAGPLRPERQNDAAVGDRSDSAGGDTAGAQAPMNVAGAAGMSGSAVENQ